MNWYVGKTGNHQGLVIDEETGANIAVAYDKVHAPLLAAAPEVLEALKEAREWLDENVLLIVKNKIDAAIAKAEESHV
jgi:hypothetical protein